MPNFKDDIKVNGKKVVDKNFSPASAVASITTDMSADTNDNELKTKVNAILAALRNANIISS